MSIDFENLSSEELFELAKRKKQEEQEKNERQQRANELRGQREQEISKHQSAIADLDRGIKELQRRREQVISEHERRLADLDKQIAEFEGQEAHEAKSQPAAQPSQPSESHVEEGAAPADPTLRKIYEMAKGRNYVSFNLLKETLQAKKLKVDNLQKILDQLVREGKLKGQGRGTYALGKWRF